MGRLRTLGVAIIALAQLFVFSLVAPFYAIVVIVVGVANLIWALITDSGFENFDLVLEPAEWAINETYVLFGNDEMFRAAPYID